MKIKKSSIFALICSLLIVSCNGSTKPKDAQVGDEMSILNGVEFDYDNAFFDDFSNGVNNESWLIGDQAWGGSNGGVVPENVSYTDDGILLLRANGGYYQEGEIKGVGDVKDGRYTGAALISKFNVGPGRYEIKMKVLPRIGACTAFWTYAYEFENELNHEIDIELPGGHRSGVVSFENLLNTNYQKVDRSHSQDAKLSSLFDEEVFLNDGEWHTFGFDWYTNPEKIVYYFDGVVTNVSDLFVPSLHSRLWVGVWFPVASAFVGSAEFETDYMQVDYISYIPFKDQPSTPFNPSVNGYANLNEYPSVPTNAKKINKVANGTFDYLDKNNTSISGWKLEKYIDEEKPVNEVCYIDEGNGADNSKGLTIKDSGYTEQKIDAVYHNFKHDFSFKAKGKGTATIYYYSTSTLQSLKTLTIDIDSENFTSYSLELTAPDNSQCMYIQFDTFNGESITVDNVTLYQK